MTHYAFIDVSGDEIPVTFDDTLEFVKARQHWQKQVESRLRNPLKAKDGKDPYVGDAFLQTREDDEGREYHEWISPKLGYARKRMSVSTDKKADFPFFIAFMTPWTRWDREEKVNEVLYSQLQFDNPNGDLEENGFVADDVGQWVPAERVSKGDTYVWKAL